MAFKTKRLKNDYSWFSYWMCCEVEIVITFWCTRFLKIFPDGLKADGSISVFNAARLRTPDGKLTIINGTATILDPSEPGKLSVSFDSVGTAGAPCKCFSRCYGRCSNPSQIRSHN